MKSINCVFFFHRSAIATLASCKTQFKMIKPAPAQRGRWQKGRTGPLNPLILSNSWFYIQQLAIWLQYVMGKSSIHGKLMGISMAYFMGKRNINAKWMGICPRMEDIDHNWDMGIYNGIHWDVSVNNGLYHWVVTIHQFWWAIVISIRGTNIIYVIFHCK